MSVFVFLCAQYLAHRMAGSTWSSCTRDVSIRIFTCSVLSPPHGRQYMKFLYQGCQYSYFSVLSMYLAHRTAGSTWIFRTRDGSQDNNCCMNVPMNECSRVNVIEWMSYVCPNIYTSFICKTPIKSLKRERIFDSLEEVSTERSVR
jgi:hypothetical protein